MSKPIIEVENLSKLYKVGTIGRTSIRDSFDNLLRKAGVIKDPEWSRFKKKQLPPSAFSAEQQGPERNTFWALKEVSFKVNRGEVVGIIGRNGAGKSTLLKILSRITEPTSGKAILRGRVASLLEVGTGFHPDLTGRENVYMNGAILGMRKWEINKKFDEIVAFAELEKFIDTPVKHYSSGMYVRLAFAVAAHLEPEILFVDEVLAVGDIQFQKKCLGKMEEVSKQGRTILFVSHNIPMVIRLCNRIVFLEQGRVKADGESQYISSLYLQTGTACPAEKNWAEKNAPGDDIAKLKSVRVLNKQLQLSDSIDIKDSLFIEIEYWNRQSRLKPTAIVQLINHEGVVIFASNDFNNKEWANTSRQPGVVKARCKVPGNFLAEGSFFVTAGVGTYNPNVVHVLEREAVSFQIIDKNEVGGVRGAYAGGKWPGVIRPMLDWEIKTDHKGQE